VDFLSEAPLISGVDWVVALPLTAFGGHSMFDLIWLALTLGLFGLGIAYLVACDRV